jgi:L-malate glycosyltransferase
MRILHIIPRWIGGGPERHLLEVARHDSDLPIDIERRLLILDRPISAPLLIRARRLGIAASAQPWREVLEREVEAADIVDITFWNHPELLELLRRPLPEARVVMRSAVAGDTVPQVLFSELHHFPDAWVLSAPPGHGAKVEARPDASVTHLASLADMGRLDGFAPQVHNGIRATYLGGLAATKLHPQFARIVKAVTETSVTFDLYGDADALSLDRIRYELRHAGVLERVAIHGHIEDLRVAFAESDIFTYPLTPGSSATSEKALQEAMWVGLPPVLLAGTAAVGWVEPGNTGFIEPDPESFASTVDRLASDTALRRRIGAGAQEHARTHFDPRLGAQRLWEVLARCLANPKRTRAPITGSGADAATKFLQSLGELAPLVNRMCVEAGACGTDVDPLLLRGEGGVLHYYNTYPNDERLRDWAEALLGPTR